MSFYKKNDFVVLLLSWMSCYCYSGHFFLKQPRKILSRFLHNQATSFFSCRYRNVFFNRRNNFLIMKIEWQQGKQMMLTKFELGKAFVRACLIGV